MKNLTRNVSLFIGIASLVATGCTHSITGTARAEPAPHVFPNLDDFTAVDAKIYYTALRGGPVFKFVTPTGLSCGITLTGPWCLGMFSSDPSEANGQACSKVSASMAGRPSNDPVYTIEPSDVGCLPAEPSDSAPLLDVGQKIVIGWGSYAPNLGTKICAVGEKGLVACIDPDRNHGFVIQRTGSWTF